MLGVRSEPVRAVSLQREIRTVGRVTADERRLHHIHTKYEAYIEHLHVDYTGKFVFHCHMLFHEDRGMMGMAEVQPG